MSKSKGSGTHTRSAVSGQYVSNSYGNRHPSTTVREAGGPSGSSGPHYRSAKSGQYVTNNYGKSHPNTTVKEK
jgi:ribosomal protein L6P/L9E